MAYDGWIELDDVELINISRTAQLAEQMSIDTVWTEPSTVAWIDDALGETDFDDVTSAPWYDAGAPASVEFAGIVPLSLVGLDDSTLEATTTEYITDGGTAGKARNRALVIVGNVALVATTPRGADYGKRWLDSRLRAAGARSTCSGARVRYFQYPGSDGAGAPPLVHRRNVALTRGTGVTRKSVGPCSTTWIVGFTWTAGDPFEYSEEFEQFSGLGSDTVVGDRVEAASDVNLAVYACPVYDYSPLYDPMYPALVPAPPPPDITSEAPTAYADGTVVNRYWVSLIPFEPSVQRVVPVLTLTTDEAARSVRVSIFSASSAPDDQCSGLLWTGFVTYLPAGVDFVIDGEQQAIYAWDRVSPGVRRTDSLVYGDRGRPVQWAALQAPEGLMVCLDVVDETAPGAGTGYDGNGTIRLGVSFVTKSD